MTLTEYIEKVFEPRRGVRPDSLLGFRIGKGKKIYWYITPMERSGLYRCLPIETDGFLGWPRFVKPKQKVTPVFEKGL